MSALLRDLLESAFADAPWIELHTIGDAAVAVEEVIATIEPDWLILELGEDGRSFDILRLFETRPRAKVLGLAGHGARSILCIQLGELSPSTLLRAVETIDHRRVLNGID